VGFDDDFDKSPGHKKAQSHKTNSTSLRQTLVPFDGEE
jgi:hypothetical protein